MSWLKRKRPKTSGSKPKRASPKERRTEYRLEMEVPTPNLPEIKGRP